MFTLQATERRWRRTEYPVRAAGGPQRLHEMGRIAKRGLMASSLHDGVDHRHGRRVPPRLAELDLLGKKFCVVLTAGVTDAVVIGKERLHDRFAANLASSGTAGYLRQQLKCPLAGAKISQAQAHICRDHADERHARKVVSL